MNINDLKSASDIAKQCGVKCLVYGPARVGKTRLVLTAPNPVMIDMESGTESLSDGEHIPCVSRKTAPEIDDFFKWVFQSKEIKNFDTVFVDSISALTEIYLRYELEVVKHKDDRQAYGEMARKVNVISKNLLITDNLNVCLIAKEKEGVDNLKKHKPWFEGAYLDQKIPFDYNQLLRLDNYKFPGVKKSVLALRAKADFGIIAGDRSGKLDDYEEPNLTNLFEKCLS